LQLKTVITRKALMTDRCVTTQPTGAVDNAQLVQHNTGKLQHPCDNNIQDRTATNL
jgi:hypothetical protein